MLNKKLFPHLPKRVFSPQTFFQSKDFYFCSQNKTNVLQWTKWEDLLWEKVKKPSPQRSEFRWNNIGEKIHWRGCSLKRLNSLGERKRNLFTPMNRRKPPSPQKDAAVFLWMRGVEDFPLISASKPCHKNTLLCTPGLVNGCNKKLTYNEAISNFQNITWAEALSKELKRERKCFTLIITGKGGYGGGGWLVWGLMSQELDKVILRQTYDIENLLKGMEGREKAS